MRTPEETELLLDKLESFLKSYEDADAAFIDKQDSDNWKSKFGERLGAYSDKLKQLNGDDFDILEASRKEHKSDYSDLSDDEYVNALEENIKKVLNRVWPEATPEQTEEVAEQVAEQVDNAESEPKEGDGTLTITEIGTDVASPEDDNSPSTEEKEEPKEEEAEEDPVSKFTKDLEDYKANMPKRSKLKEAHTF